MTSIINTLEDLFHRIPRRHTDENVKEIKSIIEEYEDVLIEIESKNPFYEKAITPFFEVIEEIKLTVKKSNEKKHSKKVKDDYFDSASGSLKDTIEQLIVVYGDGSKN